MMTRIFLRGWIFLFGCTISCSALSVDKLPIIPIHTEAPASSSTVLAAAATSATHIVSSGLRIAAISTSVLVATMTMPPVPASLAAVPTLNEAIVELSETSYPVLRELDTVNFQAFSIKIGEILLDINPDKLGKSIDLGIDVLDSAPAEVREQFDAVLKEAYADLNTDSCRLVPLPPMTIVDRFATIAAEKVDADKLRIFRETWKPSLDALQKTDDKICLPTTRASLDKLALAQADLARSFGKAETKAFASYTGPMLKTSVSPKKALSLVDDAKTLAPTASQQAKKEFATAGKKADTASQLEIARNKVAEQKARQAANKAALAKS